jgi:hypothetical protein
MAETDPLQLLRETLASLTVTVLCHPDDEEALRTAVAESSQPWRVRVYPSPRVPRGQLVALGARTMPLQPGPRRRADD